MLDRFIILQGSNIFQGSNQWLIAAGDFRWRWELDGWIILVGVLAAVSASLLGNFLVLRKMSMLGDAITHAVLPGIAVAFLLTESRNSLMMFFGAVVVGVLTALFTEWIRGVGGVDEGASMGVVFTSLFALGLVILVQAADKVDLDPNCVLYGSIELSPWNRLSIGSLKIPRAVVILTGVLLVNAVFVALFFKELKLTSFDPHLANTMGYSSAVMHYSLMVLVSITAVACFESVGSILVVAMFIVPAAAAYLLTDRLWLMIVLSVIVASASAIIGHVSAITVPRWFGFDSTTTAGMMAVAAGGIFLLAASFGPRHGVLIRWSRRQLLSLRILSDDVLALLFRSEEARSAVGPVPIDVSRRDLGSKLFASRVSISIAIAMLRRRGEVALATTPDAIVLTDTGRERAQRLVRSHRLWELYLVDQAGSGTERIHGQAEQFEHYTDRTLRDELARQTDKSSQDPHGRPIPEED